MITDKQIVSALKAVQVSMFFKEQTPYSAIANGLAEYEKVKWVEFNLDDESTWPERDERVLLYRPTAPLSDDPVYKISFIQTKTAPEPGKNPFDCYVVPTHWQRLPDNPMESG